MLSGGLAIMIYLMTLNSAVNPFIYIAFNRELRRPLLRLFPFLTRYLPRIHTVMTKVMGQEN